MLTNRRQQTKRFANAPSVWCDVTAIGKRGIANALLWLAQKRKGPTMGALTQNELNRMCVTRTLPEMPLARSRDRLFVISESRDTCSFGTHSLTRSLARSLNWFTQVRLPGVGPRRQVRAPPPPVRARAVAGLDRSRLAHGVCAVSAQLWRALHQP